MTPLFSSSRRLAVSSLCHVYSHHVGHASGTRIAPPTRLGVVKLPSRNVTNSPISRNEVQGPKERPMDKPAIAEDKVSPPEPCAPPAGPSAGGSGGGQFSTGSAPADTLIATAVGLGMSKSHDIYYFCTFLPCTRLEGSKCHFCFDPVRNVATNDMTSHSRKLNPSVLWWHCVSRMV